MNRLRVAVMALWAGGIIFLLSAQRYPLFIRAGLWPLLLGTAVIFVLFLIALTDRWGRSSSRISPAAWLQAVMLMLPLLFMFATMSSAATAGLNSYALEKRSLGMNNQVQASINDPMGAPVLDSQGLTSMEDIARRSKLVGTTVTTLGQVEKDNALPDGQFTIFRFVVVCCAADAMPVQVIVQSPDAGNLKDNDWVRVTGKVGATEKDGGRIPVLEATSVTKVAAPADPYLSPY